MKQTALEKLMKLKLDKKIDDELYNLICEYGEQVKQHWKKRFIQMIIDKI